MAVSKDDILEAISNMSVMEVVELIEAMEEKFGVSAAAAVAVAAPAAGGDAGGAAEEKTEFDVILSSFGDKKVGGLQAVSSGFIWGYHQVRGIVERDYLDLFAICRRHHHSDRYRW